MRGVRYLLAAVLRHLPQAVAEAVARRYPPAFLALEERLAGMP